MNNDKGQGLMSKYVWVIETIYRHKRLSFKELNELWPQNVGKESSRLLVLLHCRLSLKVS